MRTGAAPHCALPSDAWCGARTAVGPRTPYGVQVAKNTGGAR